MGFVVFVMFPVFALAYAMLIIFGYNIGVSKLWPALGDHGSVLVAILIAIFVWMLAVLVARTHLNRSLVVSRYLSAALFIILYLTSGFGIANYLFFLWEGPAVLQQAIERSEERVTKLQNIASAKLIPQEYLTMSDQINSGLSQLEAEIRNPSTSPQGIRYCGVGTHARQAITDIQRYLPNFRELAGTSSGSLDCNNKGLLDLIVQQYRAAATQQLSTAPLTLKYRIAERQSLLTQIAQFNTNARAELAGLRQLVSAMTFKAQNESPDFVIALQRLERLEGGYTGLRQQLASFIALPKDDLPPTLDLTAATHIGSFTSTLDVILQRIVRGEGSFANLLYVLVPLLIDFLIVLLVLTVVRRPSLYQYQRTQSGKTIKYLLTPLPARQTEQSLSTGRA